MSPMFGGGSIQLARLLGIRVGVHPSWFLMLFVVIWSLTGLYEDVVGGDQAFILATASALLFFGSVVLHELGHAVVARRNGIEIQGIDLWLFGGLARMSRDSDTPGVEFRIAVAGPVVTLMIFLAAVAALAATGADLADSIYLKENADVSGAHAVIGWLADVNLVLLVFNLIPGFPLDGGRIARAIAWKITGDRSRATRFAGGLGQIFGYLLIGFGLYMSLSGGGLIWLLWFGFMGFFIIQAARAADFQSRITSRIEGLRVQDVMDAEPVSVPAEIKLDRALEEYFLRYGYPWFPVVDAGGRFIGVISRERAEAVPEQLRATSNVDEAAQFDLGQAHSVPLDAPLESLLSSEALRALGAIMAVDGDGILRGVVTIDQVRRALRGPAPA